MPRAIIVVGLAYGDEGKGSMVDHLVRKTASRYVVRFNGGAQALHHVVNGDRVHGFSQFGSGSFAGARTILSRFMLLEPLRFCREAHTLAARGLADPYALVLVSAKAPIIAPASILANQILEIHRGAGRHGSCGMGIGLTQSDVEALGPDYLCAGDLLKPRVLKAKLSLVWQRRLADVQGIDTEPTRPLKNELANPDLDDLTAFYTEFAHRVKIVPDEQILEIIAGADTIFEGAQGVLLDEKYGFFPHNTRSNTTFENALTLLDDAGFSGERLRLGLLRAYATRHGAGPFPTETNALRIAGDDNSANRWQGNFRIGWFDAVAARYALDVVNGVDLLGITCIDHLVGHPAVKMAVRYQAGDRFPDGKIPHVGFERVALEQRTAALFAAQPEYQPLPTIARASIDEFLHCADAIAAQIGQEVTILSASAGPDKLYRPDTAQRF